MIYLDHASTTAPREAAVAAMRPWLEGPPANPASVHAAGRRARRALEDARERVARLLEAQPDEVVFTSGATEANNLALLGCSNPHPGRLIASPIEHPCVNEPLRRLADAGFPLDHLPVSPDGLVPADAPIPADARIVAVMLVNHETGAIQPVRTLADHAPRTAHVHCDAAQAVGKLAVSFRDLGVTTLTASGHKFGGPVGVGVLLVRRDTELRPLSLGGHQQHGRRPGTESVALAVGFAAALDDALRQREHEYARLLRLRQLFLDQLRAEAGPITVNGPEPPDAVPGIVNISFPGTRSDALLMALDLAGVCCSAGSACSSGSLLPSPVLRAMGLPDDRLRSALRFSFAASTTEAELATAATAIARARASCQMPR